MKPHIEKLVNETSDKAVKQAINKIAEELTHYIPCWECACYRECKTKTAVPCSETLAEWLEKVVNE